MENSVAQRLLDLNRQFYQTFAFQFSSTRQRLQPGVKKALNRLIPKVGIILDLGCGNGEVALALSAHSFQGKYLGLDASPELLDIAKNQFQAQRGSTSLNFQYMFRDLSTLDWDQNLPFKGFSSVLAFAFLHHLPGDYIRISLLKKIKNLLAVTVESKEPTYFIHSEWQFLNSERLKSRLVAWETVGLTSRDLDPGDYLLDWKHGGYGLRYVHHFSEEELERLAQQSGFKVSDSYYSDGENNRLSLYQAWEPL